MLKPVADILDCLAHLSNDEVFTPPTLANQVLDLLPERVWSDPELRWLDPGCKSGVFLREAERRLMIGLEPLIGDAVERREHIHREMLHGIAITELTALVSRRTLYHCRFANLRYSVVQFKDDEGNIRFPAAEHEWNRGRCTKCGASQQWARRQTGLETHAYPFLHMDIDDIFPEENMHFDVIMGNPPYQLADTGYGKSASPLYHRFVEVAKLLNPKFLTFVLPARWYTGGRGLDAFRSEMLADRRLSFLVDYPDMNALFDGVDIAGGGCYFLWDADHEDDCVVVPEGDWELAAPRRLDAISVFVRDDRSMSIVEKVSAKMTRESTPPLSEKVLATKPFGIRAHQLPVTKTDGPTGQNPVRLMTRDGDVFIRREDVPSNANVIDHWKVVISKRSHDHAGNPDKNGMRRVIARSRILAPPSACTETYLVAGTFPDEPAARRYLDYIHTKFFRFLLALMVPTHDMARGCFAFVPAMPADRAWTDRDLYEYFDLDNTDISHIEDRIKDFPQ